jgi:hypothetical protein
VRRPSRLSWLFAALVILTVGGVSGGAWAAGEPMVGPVEAGTMVRSTMLALDHANKTGNYTVLRDLGSTTFHGNSAARLSEVFSDLRAQNLDLSAILAAPMSFASPPVIDAKGLLRITGAAPIGSKVLQFQMAWAYEGGAWRLWGVLVTAS